MFPSVLSPLKQGVHWLSLLQFPYLWTVRRKYFLGWSNKMFLKTLTHPIKHYNIANYYRKMRIQKHKKNFYKWQYKLKVQRINICHCVLPAYHEIWSARECLLCLIIVDLWVYSTGQCLHSGQWHLSKWLLMNSRVLTCAEICIAAFSEQANKEFFFFLLCFITSNDELSINYCKLLCPTVQKIHINFSKQVFFFFWMRG